MIKTLPQHALEWPTLLLLVLTYGVWLLATSVLYGISPLLGIVLTGLAIAQHSSLQHEALHGHPFRNAALNEAIVAPALSLTVPYRRFRDTHLAHHHDPVLTDPYDDPESCYLDPKVWARLPRAVQELLRWNNTLLGRIILGPLIGNLLWLKSEAALVQANCGTVRRDWALHLLGLVPVIGWLWTVEMGFAGYVLAAWIGHGCLKIRTYLEHRAHQMCRARTVIIEDRGLLALLFLNNNFHAVHHMHPQVPWYRLPALYARNRKHYQRRTEGYVYRSYAEVFAKYLLVRKEPVAHPLYGKAQKPT
jgi:fatty acid desaturase